MNDARSLYGQPWSEREYVITLHYYYLYRDSPLHEDSSFVQELAEMLGRTPASIAMRMENFASLDGEAKPSHKGLSKGGPVCRAMFSKWSNRRDHLVSCAEVYVGELKEPRTLNLFESERVMLPKAFEKYELLDHLGDGGFANVFSCVQVETRQPCALKILRAQSRFDRETVHRFVREMRILRQVRHKHVIRVHDDNLDSEERFPAFVMDLAECSLTRYLDNLHDQGTTERPLMPPSEAAEVLRSIASAADALHRHSPNKIIHRDINPNNILLLPGGIWVLADFGLAKFVRAAATGSSFVSNTHRGYGTTYYAAPEQYQDFKRTDERTDIFAIGMLMWDLFTKGLPWPNTSESELPVALESIFVKAVNRDQSKRHQSVAELLAEFELAMGLISSDARAIAGAAGA